MDKKTQMLDWRANGTTKVENYIQVECHVGIYGHFAKFHVTPGVGFLGSCYTAGLYLNFLRFRNDTKTLNPLGRISYVFWSAL